MGLTNGTFETGDLTGWTDTQYDEGSGYGFVDVNGDAANSGTYGAEFGVGVMAADDVGIAEIIQEFDSTNLESISVKYKIDDAYTNDDYIVTALIVVETADQETQAVLLYNVHPEVGNWTTITKTRAELETLMGVDLPTNVQFRVSVNGYSLGPTECWLDIFVDDIIITEGANAQFEYDLDYTILNAAPSIGADIDYDIHRVSSIVNGDFETGDLTGWASFPGAYYDEEWNEIPLTDTIVVAATYAHNGTYGCMMRQDNTISGYSNISIWQEISTPNLDDTLSFWFKINDSDIAEATDAYIDVSLSVWYAEWEDMSSMVVYTQSDVTPGDWVHVVIPIKDIVLDEGASWAEHTTVTIKVYVGAVPS